MLLKKKIKLNTDFITLITLNNDMYVFNIQTIAKKNNKTRIIKVTTQHNLKEISYSPTEQNLVFYIDKNLDKSLSGDINDQEHRIRIYGINNSFQNSNKATKKIQTTLNQPKTNTIPKTFQKISQNLTSSDKNYQENDEIQKFKKNMEEKINLLTNQIQTLQQALFLKQENNTSTTNTKNTSLNDYDNSLSQKLKNLEEILLRIENKNQINFTKTKTTHNKYPRNGKKKGFIPIRVFLSQQKINLTNTENNEIETIRTYFLQSKIKKQIKNITIKTKKHIKTNTQISFYIHEKYMNSCDGTLNDVDNQIIFYELDKNYKYVKAI